MKLRWTRLALQDLRHPREYMSEDSPASAGKMVSRIRDAAQNQKKNPRMGKEGRLPGTRELILAKTLYIVVYILEGNEIQIVAVIHSAMRWPDSFPSEDG